MFVGFLLEHMRRAGCRMDREQVHCITCNEAMLGGLQEDGQIVLCDNHLVGRPLISATLQHELVHAFDACRAHVDWTNCLHHACTEIRAAALSGAIRCSEFHALKKTFII
uniref:Mitochondrial inner membrane protease ATP23 n=1 Tax=Compsopogon caeruleus TaxID=31354 RepID=A0A7S1XFE7_9RHOD|mmetsp:Transcript_8301/g.16882  ORF Transcript_8301/g.16882 Transcript_8301/m.16882 type:complete len:110 (+) Transcript_8301:56-385(+)